MLHLSIALAILFACCQALDLVERQPGSIPFLHREIQDYAAGWGPVILSSKEKNRRLVGYANTHIKRMEALTKLLGAPRHKVTKIKAAIRQVVVGMVYKMVFIIGQLRETPPDDRDEVYVLGQYGECYFKLYVPLHRQDDSQLIEHICVKTGKE